jgi:magnesium-transporting ATPase (P-type)
VLNQVSIAIAIMAGVTVIIIMAVLLGRGEPAGYSIVICMVIFVAVVPIGMPVRAIHMRRLQAGNGMCYGCSLAIVHGGHVGWGLTKQ